MELPPEVILLNTLKPGTVYLMEDEIFTNGKPHYVAILNTIVNSETDLLLVVGTSKVDKKIAFLKKRGLSLESVVITGPSECKFLKVDTVFDCNDVWVKSLDEVIEKVENGMIIATHRVDDGLLKKLRNAVKVSRLVEKRIKKQI